MKPYRVDTELMYDQREPRTWYYFADFVDVLTFLDYQSPYQDPEDPEYLFTQEWTLMQAIHRQDLPLLRYFLRKLPNAANSMYGLPLLKASFDGSDDVVRLLLEYGANLNQVYCQWVAQYRGHERVLLLLKWYADHEMALRDSRQWNQALLFDHRFQQVVFELCFRIALVAAQRNDMGTMERLMELQLDWHVSFAKELLMDDQTAATRAYFRQFEGTVLVGEESDEEDRFAALKTSVEWITRVYEERLVEAVRQNDLEKVDQLLTQSVDPNTQNGLPLYIAFTQNQPEMLQRLLEYRADLFMQHVPFLEKLDQFENASEVQQAILVNIKNDLGWTDDPLEKAERKLSQYLVMAWVMKIGLRVSDLNFRRVHAPPLKQERLPALKRSASV